MNPINQGAEAPDINHLEVINYLQVQANESQYCIVRNRLTGEKRICREIGYEKYNHYLQLFQRIHNSLVTDLEKPILREMLKAEVLSVGNKYYHVAPEDHGSFHAYLIAKKKLSISEAKHFLGQIAKITAFCHKRGIFLRDLKLRKLVFANEKNNYLRLEDLDDVAISKTLEEDSFCDRHGCPAYVSPEILDLSKRFYAGKPVDMWSLGVILYILVHGRYPFYDQTPAGLFDKIRTVKPIIEHHIPLELRQLIKNLLKKLPDQRPTIEDVLANHEWLRINVSPARLVSLAFLSQEQFDNLNDWQKQHILLQICESAPFLKFSNSSLFSIFQSIFYPKAKQFNFIGIQKTLEELIENSSQSSNSEVNGYLQRLQEIQTYFSLLKGKAESLSSIDKIYLAILLHFNSFAIKQIIKCSEEVMGSNQAQLFLEKAIENNCLELVRFLIAMGARAEPSHGSIPLHLAIKHGCIEIATFLLDYGVSPDFVDRSGNRALHIAALCEQEEIMQLLLNRRAVVDSLNRQGHTPLYLAAQRSAKLVQLLIDWKAQIDELEINGMSPLHTAARHGLPEVVELLLNHKPKPWIDRPSNKGIAPIHLAVEYGHIEVIRLLLKRGAKAGQLTASGNAPLHISVQCGNAKITELLLDSGISPDLRNEEGNTPLHIAILHNREKIVEILLNRGAQVNSINNQIRPIHIASQNGLPQIVQLLLHHGALINCMSSKGNTPFSLAINCGRTEVVRILLNHGTTTAFLDSAAQKIHENIVTDILNLSKENRFYKEKFLQLFRPALLEAAQNNYEKIVSNIINWATLASIPQTDLLQLLEPALSAAAQKGHEATVAIILNWSAFKIFLPKERMEFLQPSLLIATQKGRKEVVASILAHLKKEDLTQWLEPILAAAVQSGDEDMEMTIRAALRDSSSN